MKQYTKCKVVNCHALSIAKDIFCPDKDESNIIERVNAVDILNVDTSQEYWDSYDRQYYKVDIGRNFDTFVATGGVRVV